MPLFLGFMHECDSAFNDIGLDRAEAVQLINKIKQSTIVGSRTNVPWLTWQIALSELSHLTVRQTICAFICTEPSPSVYEEHLPKYIEWETRLMQAFESSTSPLIYTKGDDSFFFLYEDLQEWDSYMIKYSDLENWCISEGIDFPLPIVRRSNDYLYAKLAKVEHEKRMLITENLELRKEIEGVCNKTSLKEINAPSNELRPAFTYKTKLLEAMYQTIEQHWIGYDPKQRSTQKSVEETFLRFASMSGKKGRFASEVARLIKPDE